MGKEISREMKHPGEIVLYRTEDGRTRIECRFADENIWLTQALMAELFQTTVPNINLHIKNILGEGELPAEGTIKDYSIVRSEGLRQVERPVKHYSLEMILAVGYRVRSQRGTAFRQWATARLKEYLLKGFVLDDERLKNPPGPGVPDYFDEMLERIRDIRASERRMYLRLREIFALAADYDPSDAETAHFFQTAQNKLHFAVTGKTAPELIAGRARASLPNMGLTTWRGAVVRKGDVTVAKNYLRGEEITELNRIVTMFLDFAEDQAKRRKQVFLKDWRERLDAFLAFNERPVLPSAGSVSREEADRKAQAEYERFARRRREAAEAEGLRQLEQAAAQLAVKKAPRKERKNNG
ncbi:MAG: virulence RhuM family protein [Acidobacteriota bacterium]